MYLTNLYCNSIVLDQFSRHILREEARDSPSRSKADSLALGVAQSLTAAGDWDNELSVAEFVFCLMPFRHTATLDRLTEVLRQIDLRASQEAKKSNLLDKFRKQTLRRLQHLQDRFKVAHTSLLPVVYRSYICDVLVYFY